MGFWKEIILTKNNISKEEWLALIKRISKYNGYLRKWQIIISIENNKIRYFLKTRIDIPININNLDSFLIKESKQITIKNYYLTLPYIFPIGINTIDLINYCNIRKYGNLKFITITFRPLTEEKIIQNINIFTEKDNILIKSKLLLSTAASILSINFSNNKNFSYQKVPKYLDITKSFHILKTDKDNNIFQVDTFPYLNGTFYLNQNNIDLNKHSLILGSSGCGKSKYISSLIKNIKDTSSNRYKIIMIDPHASIVNDIGGLANIIDFKTIKSSIDLFASSTNDAMSKTELTLELFRTLINDQYNSKLERVLRYCIYILSANNKFNFNNLRNILLETEYRNNLIKLSKNLVPVSIIEFFLNDFNELKTKSYNEAISPIISFIDEMQLIPVFNEDNISVNLEDTIVNNFFTLFSLNRTILGDKVTKTITGFITEQLLTLIQSHHFDEHIILIIDEIAVVENPIICRFLSEARKYNLSLILAGQYFNQVSDNLKNAIFANVVNYYLFRLSRIDATILADYINIKIPPDEGKDIKITKENKINLLCELNNRECIIRVSSNNILLPAIKASTLDFISIPTPQTSIEETIIDKKIINKEKITNFSIGEINLSNLLKETSSSRKEVNNERA